MKKHQDAILDKGKNPKIYSSNSMTERVRYGHVSTGEKVIYKSAQPNAHHEMDEKEPYS